MRLSRQAPSAERPADLGAAYAACCRKTRAEAKNFYYAFLTLPRRRRRAICAVYAFLRALDDIADGQDPRVEERLEAERRRLAACYAAPQSLRDPELVALADAIRTFRLPREHFEAVLAGVEMDLTRTRYQTFEELKRYCYRVASAVGLICLEVFGYRDPEALHRAVDLGIAMQLTNILRDIPEDLARGRIYLPGEELARFGYSEEELARGVVNGAFRALMRFQVGRARQYFQRSYALLRFLPPRSRACPAVLAKLYQRILVEIEAHGYDVLRERVSLSTRRKLLALGEGWLSGLVCW